jgi:hypothetical protein
MSGLYDLPVLKQTDFRYKSIKMFIRERGCEDNRYTELAQEWPVVEFGISGVETSSSSTTVSQGLDLVDFSRI